MLNWFNLVSYLFQNAPFSIINISHTSPQCTFIRAAMQASASPMYLRGWNWVWPCLDSLLITTKRLQLPAESQWWLLIFLPFFFFTVVCQRQHQRSRGLLGMVASWEHISECYCSWSFSLSPLWSSLLSLHQSLHVALLPFSDPFQDGEARCRTHNTMPHCFVFNHYPTQFFFKGSKCYVIRTIFSASLRS